MTYHYTVTKHSGPPEVASQYVGETWDWFDEDDWDTVLDHFKAQWDSFEMRLGDGSVATPTFEEGVEDMSHVGLDVCWICKTDDHDSDDCCCWVIQYSFNRERIDDDDE